MPISQVDISTVTVGGDRFVEDEMARFVHVEGALLDWGSYGVVPILLMYDGSILSCLGFRVHPINDPSCHDLKGLGIIALEY